MNNRQCFALDLKEDPLLIAEYDFWHKSTNGWPEIRKSIIDNKILDMQIYRTGNRLFMIMETSSDFSIEEMNAQNAANPKVQEWEKLMWQFQQPLPWAKDGEKWVSMTQIFQL
ncbi:L-rhamnose mutarotase [Pedobacter sp. HDW13]|uniref:L-rhamnose mutarotase n=1 Tax=unclassified Pedobacter TaxID=2628915 RepID=UPI000F5A68D7|nr:MULTISPECIES: L-rhamnose mutarotase [unclassified Pedobacter]QIL40414.1 L-rhamnose mutarotase [Pedobacter sp. HDW13]RQO66646.1 L-fucose mutarotase [Pedobacter sp. KBW01]